MRRSAQRVPRRRAPAGRAEAARAKKISVTVDPNVLREVEKEARGSGRTLSAYISDALARDLRSRRLQSIIDEYEAEHGIIDEKTLSAVRARWQG